jgi:subtilase family serine protease
MVLALLAAGCVANGLDSTGDPVTPITASQCRARFNLPCYGARQIQRAYGADALLHRGITGRGTTLAIVMPQGNPEAKKSLEIYSQQYGLPEPELEVIKRGNVHDVSPSDAMGRNETLEADLNLQMMHAMAPEAQLILVSTPTSFTTSFKAMQEISDAVGWLSVHRPVTAISMPYGICEENFPEAAGRGGDYHQLDPMRAGLKVAAEHHVTMLAGSGDFGPTCQNLSGRAFYHHPAVYWPASDPLITGVAGARLHLDDTGTRISPDTLWTEERGGHASGAGRSRIWPSEGSADVAAIASDTDRVWAYSDLTDDVPGRKPQWTRLAGVSVATPVMTGLVALAAQQARSSLGNLAPRLHRIHPGTDGTQDLTAGCNSANRVKGVCASPGRDTASGIGTVTNATAFTAALARD